MLKKGFKPKNIAELIGKHKSSIYRKINRNKDKRSGVYKPELAERKYKERHKLNLKENEKC